jgi:hypothetical protein
MIADVTKTRDVGSQCMLIGVRHANMANSGSIVIAQASRVSPLIFVESN